MIEWSRIRAAQLHAGRKLALFLLADQSGRRSGDRVPGQRDRPCVAGHAGPRCSSRSPSRSRSGVSPSPHTGDSQASVHDLRETVLGGPGARRSAGRAYRSCSVRMLAVGHDRRAWIALSLLMTAAAFAMAPLPLATLSFLGYLGASMVDPAADRRSDARAAIGILGFTLLLMVGMHQPCARAGPDPRQRDRAGRTRRDRQPAAARIRGHRRRLAVGDRRERRDRPRVAALRASRAGSIPVTINGMPLLQVLAGPSWDSGQVRRRPARRSPRS